MNKWIFILCVLSSQNMQALDKYNSVKIYLELIPKSVEVTKLSTIYSATISRHITESLFVISRGYEVKPELASKHWWDKDFKNLTIVLKDTSFSNGVKLNADHVISSLSRCIKSPANKASLALSKVIGYNKVMENKSKYLEGLVKINENILKIKLEEAAPLLIDELAMGTCNIWYGKNDDLFRGAIGTGPYTVEKYSDKEVILSKRLDIAEYLESPKRIIITDLKTYERDKETYDLHIKKELKKIKGFKSYVRSALASEHLVLNNTMPPYNDINNRRLIEAAIDYKAVRKFFKISPKRMQKGLISYGVRGYKSRELLDRNHEKIKLIFGKFGYNSSNKLPLYLHIRNTKGGRSELYLWQEMFKNYPIDFKIVFVEANQLFNQKMNKKFMAMRVGKAAGAIDPFRLFASYHSSSTWNTAHSKQKGCDVLIENGLKIIDRDSRYNIYEKIDNCLIDENHILIPLFTREPSYVYIRNHWKLKEKNRFLIYPHQVYKWMRSEL